VKGARLGFDTEEISLRIASGKNTTVVYLRDVESLEYDAGNGSVLISTYCPVMFEESRSSSPVSPDLSSLFVAFGLAESDKVVRISGLTSELKWSYIACCLRLVSYLLLTFRVLILFLR
jgi:hypothetical protein